MSVFFLYELLEGLSYTCRRTRSKMLIMCVAHRTGRYEFDRKIISHGEKVKPSLYRPGLALRAPGGSGSQEFQTVGT
jgi:hypothetical protein